MFVNWDGTYSITRGLYSDLKSSAAGLALRAFKWVSSEQTTRCLKQVSNGLIGLPS
jgi:hypothetical protein